MAQNADGSKTLYLALDHYDWKIVENRDIMLNKLVFRADPLLDITSSWTNVFRSLRDREAGFLFESVKIDAGELEPEKVALCSRRRNAATGVTQLLFMLSDDTQISRIHTKLMRQQGSSL